MALPLYNGAQSPAEYPPDANSGLWYDKFCNTWANDFSKFIERNLGNGRKENGKKIWIDQMAAVCVGNAKLLAEADARRTKLIKTCAGHLLTAVTSTAFVSGLGRSHPVENGFCWHHTLGAPYLPGSSVKGVVRAWAVLNKKDKDNPDGSVSEEEINHILGPRGNGAKNAGSVIFMDALPLEPVQLKTEIMTPHYGPWYQKKETPGDWHDPTPIPFLAVAADQTFRFGIMPRVVNDGTGDADCIKALEWLEKTLVWLGAGAKTSVMGYFDVRGVY